jgi:hypothetical protein
MNFQTHKAIPTFPLGYHYQTETEAIARATDYSRAYSDQFIYVIHSTTSGRYRLDYIGLKFSDEQILATFKQGEKTL